MNFTSREEYIRAMYYIFHIEELTTVEMALLFKRAKGIINAKLHTLGFSISHEESIARKKKKGRQNYEKTMRSGKTTRIKDQIRNTSVGTKNENYARSLFAYFLYDYFDSNVFEIVVGINNTGILGEKEIDIPIIIYERENGNLFRFAVEYNGPDHNFQGDIEKEKIASSRGWVYLPLVESDCGRFSNNPKQIEQCVRTICQQIKEIVSKIKL